MTANNEFHCTYPDCNASFPIKQKLELHIKVHQNVGYKCQFCRYKNSQWQNLTQHLNSHFDKRSHKCELCDKTFMTKGHLNYHFETKHEAILVKCPLCPRENTLEHMRKHIYHFHKIKGASLDRTNRQFILPDASLK